MSCEAGPNFLRFFSSFSKIAGSNLSSKNPVGRRLPPPIQEKIQVCRGYTKNFELNSKQHRVSSPRFAGLATWRGAPTRRASETVGSNSKKTQKI